ncbi:hypothetical protein Val02_09370 [Virgisporangium aliadipatigenens]|uniref:Uncharacterized protein n=1 Tax=Virgisporangium aliadipatigenens TaxID=741659 RepID=A0A8J4DNQ3_9ACTN|nr:hypothetical protein [Virgisporangium aliadipatigenens]GIJ44051.1 hypothetical protein Val02_09370 [Virgisporangium aliadipatigenens]
MPFFRARFVVLAACLLVAAGCRAAPERAPSGDRTTVAADTVGRARLGARLVVTAAVVKRLGAYALVVEDVDLPAQGLLVFARHPVDADPPVLVTAAGTVAVFRGTDFAPDQLEDRRLFAPFEGRRALLSAEVKVW